MPTDAPQTYGRPLSYAERKRRVAALQSNDLIELALAAGFDPAVHFRFWDWRGADLRGLNLRGFDFTGAMLHGAQLDGALIGPGPDSNGKPAPAARFDLAEIGAVLPQEPIKPSYVYVSHAGRGMSRLAPMVEALVAGGLSVTGSALSNAASPQFDPFRVSEIWNDNVEATIRAADAVLICWVPNAKVNEFMQKEASLALQLNSVVGAWLGDDGPDLPEMYSHLQMVKLNSMPVPALVEMIREKMAEVVERRQSALPTRVTPLANLQAAADWDAYLKGWNASRQRPKREHLYPGAIFHDAPFASQMVVVPPGKFTMGSSLGLGDKNALPRHKVIIGHRLAVGRFPVTFEEWDACQADGGTKHHANSRWGRGRQPVINVSWNDITNDYLPWLNRKLGFNEVTGYRLLTEAEWEYCCRAGNRPDCDVRDSISTTSAQFSKSADIRGRYTVEVGSFPANAYGLHDMLGNVSEWCADPWHPNYEGAPIDGMLWSTGGDRRSRVLRGGTWFRPEILNSARRDMYQPDFRFGAFGFRVSRTLTP